MFWLYLDRLPVVVKIQELQSQKTQQFVFQ